MTYTATFTPKTLRTRHYATMMGAISRVEDALDKWIAGDPAYASGKIVRIADTDKMVWKLVWDFGHYKNELELATLVKD